MKKGRISPKTKNRFKHAIKDLIKGLSRKVKVHKQPLKNECYNCFYDKLTNSSTGKCKWTALEATTKQQEYETDTSNTDTRYKFFKFGRCPVCKGKGYIETQRSVWIECLVTWNPKDRDNEAIYTPAGPSGSTSIQLKTDPKHFKLFNNCSTVVIDGVDCKMSEPPILRGLGNESLLIIMLHSNEGLQAEKEPSLKNYFDD